MNVDNYCVTDVLLELLCRHVMYVCVVFRDASATKINIFSGDNHLFFMHV